MAKHYRDKAYLSFIRSRSCLVTGRSGENIVAHHVRMGNRGGMGLKPSDYMTVPLDAIQHTILHNQGEKSFWKNRGINPDQHILTHLLLYLTMETKRRPRSALELVSDTIWLLKEKPLEIGF